MAAEAFLFGRTYIGWRLQVQSPLAAPLAREGRTFDFAIDRTYIHSTSSLRGHPVLCYQEIRIPDSCSLLKRTVMSTLVGQTVSHYKILEQLGGGGMGVVYKAHDTKLDRTVALKLLPPDLTLDPEARARFILEAKAASALQHDHICTIHDIDASDDGRMFIVMDYYQGETLKKKIERGPLPVEDARTIAVQVADGLAEAHRHGFIHRDIKPANVMVTNRGEAKIVDFGLAKLAGQTTLTRSGTRLGTAAYMSPEQARGEIIDRRTDIWSLGVVLYEMLTGHHPFRGEHPLAILYSIQNEDPRDPSEIRTGLPEELKAVCLRCLHKNPDLRPASMDEVRGLLEGVDRRKAAARSMRFPQKRTVRWLILPLAIVAIGVVIYTLAPARAIPLEPADFVVVADFENKTRDSVLDNSLTEAIRVSLRQSAQFAILPRDRISRALELLQVSNPRLDERSALAVARREGARVVLSGNVSRLGSTYSLSCAIIDASTGETVSIVREDLPRIDEVLPGLDRLCGNVRERLGESITQISAGRLPLDQVTTPSLEALELYSRGDVFEAQGKYREAVMLKERAIAIDSQFVMAISDVSYGYRKIGNDSLAASYHQRILPLIHRVTDRERLEILSLYYGPAFELDFQKARECLDELTVKYPNDAYAFATLGHLAMAAGDTKTALEANEKAVAMYPEYAKTCYNNSGYALALAGRPDEALGWFRKAKALRPDYYAIDLFSGMAYWMKERNDSAEVMVRSALQIADPSQRYQLHGVLSLLYSFQGHFATARAECLAGLAECRRMKRPSDEAYFHYLLGELSALEGRMGEYRTEMRLAASQSTSPYFELVLVGWSYARHRMSAKALTIVERVERMASYDPIFIKRRPSYLELLRGEIAFAQGTYRDARGHFEAVEGIRSGDPILSIARRRVADCAAMTADSSAPALYEAVLNSRGQVVFGYLSPTRQTGPWTRSLWPETHVQLARWYFSQGRDSLAGEHVAAALRSLSGADPADRLAAEARELKSRLAQPP
jgi:tetratricopeptide (TPR) repeat protein/TolB-like protein